MHIPKTPSPQNLAPVPVLDLDAWRLKRDRAHREDQQTADLICDNVHLLLKKLEDLEAENKDLRDQIASVKGPGIPTPEKPVPTP